MCVCIRLVWLFFPVDYTVRTKTGSRENAGTDDCIYISITAANCNFGEYKLDDPKRDDFQRGREDAFMFSSLHLGNVSHSVLMAHGIKTVRTTQFKATVSRCDSKVVFSRLSTFESDIYYYYS